MINYLQFLWWKFWYGDMTWRRWKAAERFADEVMAGPAARSAALIEAHNKECAERRASKRTIQGG